MKVLDWLAEHLTSLVFFILALLVMAGVIPVNPEGFHSLVVMLLLLILAQLTRPPEQPRGES